MMFLYIYRYDIFTHQDTIVEYFSVPRGTPSNINVVLLLYSKSSDACNITFHTTALYGNYTAVAWNNHLHTNYCLLT